MTDEIYEHLVYGTVEFSSIVTQVPELADTCVVVNGVAKTYAMTGLASRMAHRAERCRQGGNEPAVTRDIQRRERVADCRPRSRQWRSPLLMRCGARLTVAV